jgi:C4-dicarboxylate transporter DctM subunit
MTAALAIAAFLALLTLGFPVFIAMGLVAGGGHVLVNGTPLETVFTHLALTSYQILTNFILLAVPLYVLAGTLMEESGLNQRLFDFAAKAIGALRGGLGVATIVACAIFAAICGSSVATAATIGLVAFPALTRQGYSPAFSGALIASGGTLGILIPPSIPMIVFGVLTDQSVGQLFVAGVVPGIILAFLMALYASAAAGHVERAPPVPWREKLAAARDAVWALALPLFVLGAIYTGIATPTEVAALAVVYIALVGIATGSLRAASFHRATLRAVRTSAMIFMLVAFGQVMTNFLAGTGAAQAAVALIGESGLPRLAVIAAMVLLYIVLGTVLESLSMMLVSVPILFPIALALDIPPLAFGIFVVLAMEAALIHPPVGVNLFTVAGMTRARIDQLSLHVVPYVLLLIAMMFLVTLAPGLATWLPGTMRF